MDVVLKDCMPGEYGSSYGEWSFDCFNAEGYVAETGYSNESNIAEDGYAAIYGYADAVKESRLELTIEDNDKLADKIAVGYFLKINGTEGMKLSLNADIDSLEKNLLKYEVSGGNTEIYCEGERIYKSNINEWDRYVISFDRKKREAGIYINSKLIKTLNLSAEEISTLNKMSFVFKSANFEDCYGIDDVAIIY